MAKPKIDVGRLAAQMYRARLALQKPREERVKMVERYGGAHWGPYGRTSKDDPVNLLARYVTVVGQKLISKNPRVMLSTFDPSQKAAVEAMQQWVNAEVERTNLAKTLERAIIDALFCVGIVKVGLATPSDAATKAWALQAGQPFCERIDLDDFVFDIHARDFSEVSFIGHRYRVPLDTVKDSNLYSKARKSLVASNDRLHNEQGDERISVLGRGWLTGNDEEFEDMIDLWEVYLPRHRVILTLADDYLTGAQPYLGDSEEGLRRQNWVGPDQGPIVAFGFGVMPGNAMPKAPIPDLFSLHESTNRSVRKAVRGVDRLKEVVGYQGTSDADAKRIVESNDGDLVRLDNPEGIKQLLLGAGAIQAAVGMAEQLKGLFNDFAGNLELLGGGGPQAKTATQDTLLNQNAGATVGEMQETTTDFVADVFKRLCWFWWHHPTLTMANSVSPRGLPGITATQRLHPNNPGSKDHESLARRGALMRRGEMPQVGVDPYSLRHATPESRVADLDQFMTQIFVPLAPLLQSQGIVIDMQQYLKKRAFYRNMPDLPDILSMQEAPSPDGGPGRTATDGQGQPGKPASTSRTYTRQNVSEATPQGQRSQLVNNLLSGKSTGGTPNGAPAGVG